MNFIIIFFFVFFVSMTFFEFKKSKELSGFKYQIKGRITGITPKENGVYFEVEYLDDEIIKKYEHLYIKKKISLEKAQMLAEHFLDSPFFMVAKKENEKIIEIKAYSNSKIMKWIYLLGSLISIYFISSISF